MTQQWCVWTNAWPEAGGPPLTHRVTVTAKTRNRALKLGNRKLGIPLARREPLRIFPVGKPS